MSPSRSLLALSCIVLGCGARSEIGSQQLLDGAGGSTSSDGGAGGHDGGAGGDAAGGRGQGGSGATAACNNLTLLDTYRSFDVTDVGSLAYQPRLAVTSADGQRVTLVVREQPEPIPIDGHPVVTRVTFEPWGSWPAAPLGSSQLLSAGSDFVLPRQADEGLSAWLFMSTFVTGPQMALLQNVPDNAVSPTPIVAYGGQVAVPAFVTASLTDGRRGLGRVQAVAQPLAWLDIADASALHPTPSSLGCFLLDGVRASSHLLFACSSPSGFRVGRFGPTTPEAETTHEHFAMAPAQLQMVPHGQGAWVVWQSAGGVTPAPLEAMRLDGDGNPVTDAMQLVAEGIIFEEVALAPLGDDLALAHSDPLDPGRPNLFVRIFDAEGSERTAAGFTPQASPRLAESYGLVGSATGDALLLAWSSAEQEPGVQGNAQVYVARLDCEP